jgi:hypothetical protein
VFPALRKCAIPGEVSAVIGCNFEFATSKEFQAELKKPVFLSH